MLYHREETDIQVQKVLNLMIIIAVTYLEGRDGVMALRLTVNLFSLWLTEILEIYSFLD